MSAPPARSLLFAPGSDARKLRKALASDADAVVADLEDAVAPGEKEAARATIAAAYAEARGRPGLMVRVNEPDGPWGRCDLDLVRDVGSLAAVLVPKASQASIDALPTDLPPVIPIIETAAGVQDSARVARCANVRALTFGAIDLAAEIDLEARPDGLQLVYARSKLVLDSAAASIEAPIDTAFAQLGDDGGFRAECALARSLGFRGKCCIHPAQVPMANEAFALDAETRWARETLAAYERAVAEGDGVLARDGEMIDMATVRRARRLLDAGDPSPSPPTTKNDRKDAP